MPDCGSDGCFAGIVKEHMVELGKTLAESQRQQTDTIKELLNNKINEIDERTTKQFNDVFYRLRTAESEISVMKTEMPTEKDLGTLRIIRSLCNPVKAVLVFLVGGGLAFIAKVIYLSAIANKVKP